MEPFFPLHAYICDQCLLVQLEEFESPEIRAVVQFRQGQTLRDISAQYYSTPNHWRVIQDFNGFESSVVAPGTTVLVPEL